MNLCLPRLRVPLREQRSAYEPLMRNIQQARLIFINLREEILDPFFADSGFLRSKRSYIYRKKSENYLQEIWVEPNFREHSLGPVDMDIDPVFRWKLPAIKNIVLELTGNDEFLVGGTPDLVVAQSVRFFVAGKSSLPWRVRTHQDCELVGRDICQFISKHIFPMLGDMKNIDDFINLYEADDQRIWKQQHRYVFVAAAYLLSEQIERAHHVMDTHLGRPGLRKQYAPVFKRLNQLRAEGL